jgi:hypothetical protein
MLATMLLSHAGDDAAEATWPRCDVDVESYWQQRNRVMLATMLLSHAGDDTAESIEVLSHHEEVRYLCWLIAK